MPFGPHGWFEQQEHEQADILLNKYIFLLKEKRLDEAAMLLADRMQQNDLLGYKLSDLLA
jgi:hypothetical protein